MAMTPRIGHGFCADCGTPLTYEVDGRRDGGIEIAIGAFDDPAAIPPTIQVGVEARMPWFHDLADLPGRPPENEAKSMAFQATIVSYQHPDHDTDRGPGQTTPDERTH